MSVLVTGSYGFLGRHVVRRLRRDGYKVLEPLRQELDLLDEAGTLAYLRSYRPELVYHLAAVCGGIGANRAEPARFLRDNAVMGLHLLEACRLAEVGRVVMVGSTCSYPCHAPLPFREADLWAGYPEPTNAPYGVAKRLLLTAAQAYREQHGLHAVTLIPTNLYGPGDHVDLVRSHVIPAMIAKLHAATVSGTRQVDLWGDGSPTRDFLYVEDCAAALVRAATRYDAPEPVNLGSGREVSMHDLAELLAQLLSYQGELRWDPSQPNGQPRRCLDTSRARELLGWEAQTGLEDGLQRTVAWYRVKQ
jgi:GDP-L-fucose synthase